MLLHVSPVLRISLSSGQRPQFEIAAAGAVERLGAIKCGGLPAGNLMGATGEHFRLHGGEARLRSGSVKLESEATFFSRALSPGRNIVGAV